MKKLIQILITFGLVVVMGGTASGQSYGDLEDSCKLGPVTDDLIKDVQYWVKEKRPGAEQLLKECLNKKEMDSKPAEIEKAKEMARKKGLGESKGLFEKLREIWDKVTK